MHLSCASNRMHLILPLLVELLLIQHCCGYATYIGCSGIIDEGTNYGHHGLVTSSTSVTIRLSSAPCGSSIAAGTSQSISFPTSDEYVVRTSEGGCGVNSIPSVTIPAGGSFTLSAAFSKGGAVYRVPDCTYSIKPTSSPDSISTSTMNSLLKKQEYIDRFDSSDVKMHLSAIQGVGDAANASQPFKDGNATCPALCGDGLKLPLEGCDDGNVVDGDGCSSSCKIEAGALCSFASAPAFTCTPAPQGPSSCFFPRFNYVKLFESSSFPGGQNTIYFCFRANKPLVSMLHIKISGLTGTDTADNSSFPITLSNNFSVMHASWKQATGDLDMEIDTHHDLEGELFLSFNLTNPSTTQAAVHARIQCIDCVICPNCSQSTFILQSFVNGSILGVQVANNSCKQRDNTSWFGPNCSVPCHGVVQINSDGHSWCECPSGAFGISCEHVVKADANLSVDQQLVQPSTEIVGVKGGDGDGVEFPPGAFASSLVVSVLVYKTDPAIPEDQSDLKPMGKVMELKPDGVTFQEPVTIVIAITEQAIAQAKSEGKVLEIRFLDQSSGQWVSAGGQVQQFKGAPVLVTKSLHFSLWAAMSGNPPPTTTTSESDTATTQQTTTPPPSWQAPHSKSPANIALYVGLAAALVSLLIVVNAVRYCCISRKITKPSPKDTPPRVECEAMQETESEEYFTTYSQQPLNDSLNDLLKSPKSVPEVTASAQLVIDQTKHEQDEEAEDISKTKDSTVLGESNLSERKERRQRQDEILSKVRRKRRETREQDRKWWKMSSEEESVKNSIKTPRKSLTEAEMDEFDSFFDGLQQQNSQTSTAAGEGS
eukprot:768408-Hanusia_phi.AAC.1